MIDLYYIESLSFPGDDTDEIGEAIISNFNHPECIHVLGTKHELTQRVVQVLIGLNAK
jgi:hypothetical protein